MKEVEFLQFLLENMVSNPEDIKIERKEDELGVLLTVSANKEDMGVIIGKGGNNINSIRSILRLVGMKLNKKINIKVLD
ncbi:MAG: KH domain-containing protein [Candidatus Gracilibacteria bacterium]|nr:KH domain-containing protein [Candidatus Gracilibacteria bacterium]